MTVDDVMNLTQEEKDDLINKVTELTNKGVIKRPDSVTILRVCSEACARRMKEIEDVIGPDGPIQ